MMKVVSQEEDMEKPRGQHVSMSRSHQAFFDFDNLALGLLLLSSEMVLVSSETPAFFS
jgi:hypothetical protein